MILFLLNSLYHKHAKYTLVIKVGLYIYQNFILKRVPNSNNHEFRHSLNYKL